MRISPISTKYNNTSPSFGRFVNKEECLKDFNENTNIQYPNSRKKINELFELAEVTFNKPEYDNYDIKIFRDEAYKKRFLIKDKRIQDAIYVGVVPTGAPMDVPYEAEEYGYLLECPLADAAYILDKMKMFVWDRMLMFRDPKAYEEKMEREYEKKHFLDDDNYYDPFSNEWYTFL